MKNTGALLKSKRESSGLSLSEVALATKINPKILAAIENGDESNLPAKTFLKGFVRSYALYLKMDVDEVMRSYQEETGGPPPERMIEPVKAETSTSSSRRRVGDESSSGMRTVAVVVIVMLIGLIIGVRELIEKYQRERVVESTDLKVTPVATTETPEAPGELSGAGGSSETKLSETSTGAPEATQTTDGANPTDTANTAEPTKETVPATEPAKAPALESKPADTQLAEVKPPETKLAETKPSETKPAETKPPEAKPSEAKPQVKPVASLPATQPTLLQRPNNLVELRTNSVMEPKPQAAQTPAPAPAPATTQVQAPPKPAETVAATPAAPATPAPAVTPEQTTAPKPPTTGAAKNEIILEALDKVEVKFQVKGETKRISLGPTQVHTIHAEAPMTLDLSDGGAVNIILNGRERGVPGDLGKPKTIKIP